MDPQDRRDDSSINIPGYGKLPFVDKNPRNFFRRTTILYGPSETGKTIIGKWIMEILKPYIPNIIVICPTEGANEGYKGIVPERCIFTKIDIKTLKDIYDRQLEATEIYNKANNMDMLKTLFTKINDMSATSIVDRIDRMSNFKITEVRNSVKLNFAQKKEQIKAMEKNRNSVMRRIYKKTIKNYKDRLLARYDLTEDERYAIKYIDFNPSLLLILDDCQAEIAVWGQDESINKLFYQGRHVWVTSLYMLQSDSGRPGLAPGIRNNTFNNFFTDPNIANRFFNNKENGFTTEMKKQAQKIVNELFRETINSDDNFKRFCYSRLDPKAKFRYVIADEPENLKFGSPALWQLCDKCPTDQKKSQTSKFARSFGV